jgi:pimeloyl-ACP methyl ester carboxylesterase
MICQVSDLAIYYEIHGEGTPILMLHGFYPDHRSMKGCLEPIFVKQPGWKRIYLDLPGMGQTKGQNWLDSSDKMLQVVLEFVEHVIPHQSFLIVGDSYGAYLARGIVYKQADRVDGICLVCPCIVADSTKRTVPLHQTLVRDQELLSSLSADEANEFESIAVIQNRRNWERFRDEIFSGVQLADSEFLERLRQNGYTFSFPVDSLEKPFEKPTLILTGRQDAMVGYRDAWEILENYPRATFAVLDAAGHILQIEQERLFEELVCEWLERVKAEKGDPSVGQPAT